MISTNNSGKKRAEASTSNAADPRDRFTKQAQRLLREVPISKVISEYTPLRGSTKRLTGNCPRHDQPNLTLKVYPKTNMFECFFCGMRGDAITFLEMVEELTYGQALEALEQLKYSDEHDAA